MLRGLLLLKLLQESLVIERRMVRLDGGRVGPELVGVTPQCLRATYVKRLVHREANGFLEQGDAG